MHIIYLLTKKSFKTFISFFFIVFIFIFFFASTPEVLAQATQTIKLKQGFNFIGFTVDISLTADEFKQLNPAAIEDIYLFSAAAGSFLSMNEGTLSTLSAGKGYIIKNAANSDITINISGKPLSTIGDLTIKTGFNLVGFSKIPSTAQKFSKLMNDYPVIRGIYKWSYLAGSFVQVVQNDGIPVLLDGVDPEFKEGESYFFKILSDTSINYDGSSITLANSASTNTNIALNGALPSINSSASSKISICPADIKRAITYDTDFELTVMDMDTMTDIPAQISITGSNYTAIIAASNTQVYNAMTVIKHKASQKIIFSAACGRLPLKSDTGNIETISIMGLNINAESSALAALANDKKISTPFITAHDNIKGVSEEIKSAVIAAIGETIAVEFTKAVTTVQAAATSSILTEDTKTSLCSMMDIKVKNILNAFHETVKLPRSADIISSAPGAASSITMNQTIINASSSTNDIENAAGGIKIVVQPPDIKVPSGTQLSAITFPSGVTVKNSASDTGVYSIVTWQMASVPPYDQNTPGSYIFTGEIAGSALKTFIRVIISAYAEKPVFNPGNSFFFDSCQITITSATPDAVIRYTLDNSTPGSSSAIYNGPITLTQSSVIRAFASKQGLLDSQISFARYDKANVNGMISFVSNRDSGINDIYTLNADGSALTRLTQADNHNGAPDISPDGTNIIFSASQVNTATLYGGARINIMNTDGSSIKSLYYEDGTRSADPSYSADGSKIVFIRHISSSEARIVVMNADGSNSTDIFTINLTGDSTIKNPRFSPDGSKIIYTLENSWLSIYELYVISSNGGPETLIASNAINAVFASDGKVLYCEYGPAGGGRGIIRCTASGASPEILIPYLKIADPNNPANPSCVFDISPDGKYIAFTKNREICIINSDGSGNAMQITSISQCGSLRWKKGNSGFAGRIPSEIKLCSDTGSTTNPPTEIPGSIEKIIADTIYPMLNIKAIIYFENDIIINNTYQKMRQWINPVWTIVSGAGKITGDLYKYFTAPSTEGSTIIKATYTESGKQVSAEFTFNAINFNAGGKIYFSSNKDGYYEIYRADYNGSNITRLTSHRAYSHSPSVSADGTKIAYVTGASTLNYNDREIYVINSDGTGAARITNNSLANYSPSFSPDGKSICYGEDGKIMTASIDGSGVKTVTGASDVSNSYPLFTADGMSITFASSHKEGNFYVSDGHFIISINGGTRTQISAFSLDEPCMTHDGKIAFIRYSKLYAMNYDGSGMTELLPMTEASCVTFSPDGKFILYTTNKIGASELCAAASNGMGEKIMIGNGNLGTFATSKIAWGK